MKLSIKEINEIIACPTCKGSLTAIESTDIICIHCGEIYKVLQYSWDFTPSYWKRSSELWEAWETVQANGVVSYNQDPEHNLGVGERADYLAFGDFCKFDGLVLDVGCGPQSWPTHFTAFTPRTRFVGIDPLVGESESSYTQLRGLGEYLPFQDSIFSHVVFATSLDHFIDPVVVLKESARVCHAAGQINIWVGEKSSNAPKPKVSNAWYADLVKPEEADDVFHLKRLSYSDLHDYFTSAGLSVCEEKVLRVDEYRSNYFFRLRKGN